MISAIIRKISIGPDYKDAMHYQVGQKVVKGSAEITHIIKDSADVINLYVNVDGETHLWKSFVKMPVSIEFDIE